MPISANRDSGIGEAAKDTEDDLLFRMLLANQQL